MVCKEVSIDTLNKFESTSKYSKVVIIIEIQIENSDYIKFIEFFILVDTVPMKVGRQKLLRISKVIDNYSGLYFVWNPKTKMIASYDAEHEELIDISKFDEFMNNAGT